MTAGVQEAKARVRFTVYQPGIAPQQVSLHGDTITLGRASDCTIPIKDRFLSRRHAEIICDRGTWYVRDCGSVNGTLVNGVKVVDPVPLRAGDRIALGDSEVVFHADEATSQLIPVDSDSHATNLAIKVDEEERGTERTRILNSLAIEFLADRPMSDLFEFILDRVVGLLHPSRAALALFGEDRADFDNVKLRRQDPTQSTDLLISRTLLREVVDGRKVVSYFDTSQDEKLARAQSIIAQNIRSAVCAPLLVGDAVLGVLYIDYTSQRGAVTENDVRLMAQIARFAAVTLERTRLREEAFAKAKIDEELRTAYAIQKRLLPASLPVIDGYTFAASNRPAKSVSGDYYDIVVRPDGRIYFVIADVSGKGITAALVMSSVATAFNIFTRTDPTPADLLRELNATLAPKTAPTKFVTLVAGVLDPTNGHVEFANAGHVPPLIVSSGGVEALRSTDLVVGLFPHAQYRNQTTELKRGDALVLFTDGVTEAEDAAEVQLGLGPVAETLKSLHCENASKILAAIEEHVNRHVGDAPAGDDVTMLALTRCG
ncbi:MAG TPA: SpoIIE family protein phosphatase [Thermoanaerobaculia bacterium]|nr:SpoIIE family protein phosphatase [Thermoanaerobaculia bacterium]